MAGVRVPDGEQLPAPTLPPSLPPAPLPSPAPLDRWRAENSLLLPVITPSFPACAKYDKKSFGKNPNLQFSARRSAGAAARPNRLLSQERLKSANRAQHAEAVWKRKLWLVLALFPPSVKYSLIWKQLSGETSTNVFSCKKWEICQGFGEEEKLNLRSSPLHFWSSNISFEQWLPLEVGINRDWVGFIAKPRVAAHHLLHTGGPAAD